MAPSKPEQVAPDNRKDGGEDAGKLDAKPHGVIENGALRHRNPKENGEKIEGDASKWSSAGDDWKLMNGISDVVRDVKEADDHVDIFVAVKELPSWSKLNSEVNKIIAQSSWWERYGVDWMYLPVSIALFACGLLMVRMGGVVATVLGVLLMGCCHGVWADKIPHIAVHNGMSDNPHVNKGLMMVLLEFMGGFSLDVGYDIHIKSHHPHTNIIGLGDSSTWKVPLLPRDIYMFIAPVLLPALAPLISIRDLITERYWAALVRFIILCSLGIVFTIWLLMHFAGLSLGAAIATKLAYTAVLAVPYVHVNIFQHIGLPMWDGKHRPARIYQMASGCLNLNHNFILDHCFGHSLVSCHIEHHLFPRLSDNMCLKVRPLVRTCLKEAGLPYTETSYSERLWTFYKRYNELMVNAPPITHFIGLQ